MSMSTGKVRRTLIMGLGNVLLGDDGFGPCVIELFRCRYQCGPDVEILDLGSPGLDLASYLYGRELVIIVDAINATAAAGTLCDFSLRELSPQQVQLRLSGHDPGLTEAFCQLGLLNQAPAETIAVGAVPKSCAFNQGISGEVFRAASAAADHIAGLLTGRGVSCARRRAPLAPKLWWLANPRCPDATEPFCSTPVRELRG
jgi:hydrogenase maturation protease